VTQSSLGDYDGGGGTACWSCGGRVRDSTVAVWVRRDPDVARVLCLSCQPRYPGNQQYHPERVPERSETDLSERGRDRR
jgi:hypothetical protein